MSVSEQAPILAIARRPRLAAVAAALLGLVVVPAIGFGQTPSDPAAPTPPQAPPNIVVLLTDDQETASLRVMKTVRKEMKNKGVTMKRAYANFPLCCPSRATMLTGQYAHNHGVLSNSAPDGGYGLFNELHGDNYLPIWLQNAGYTTGYIGKYLNEYAEPDEFGTVPTDVPRGWDQWLALAPSNAQYFDYILNQNGTLNQYTSLAEDYSTDRFTTKAKRFIRTNARSPEPFFLTVGYAAPHGGGGGDPGRSCNRGAIPAPRHLSTLKDKRKGQLPASFNEADVADKPSPIRDMQPLTPGQVRDVLRKRRCAWESLLAVDESVGTLIDELERSGERRQTYIFFLSDNGYLRGEHRIRNQKRYLYEKSSRIPLIVRGPGIPQGQSSDDVVTNADLVPTILEISGAAAGEAQDGQSLLPSLADPDLELGRSILLEAFAGRPILGVRNARYLYTEWDTGSPLPERELYDTLVDPDQLVNLIGDPNYALPTAELAAELDRLVDCAGPDCRGAPAGDLQLLSSGEGKGCSFSPVTARMTTSDDGGVTAVDFAVAGSTVATDTEAPFETVLPDAALRAELPDEAEVVARALFDDGRRLARSANIRVCR